MPQKTKSLNLWILSRFLLNWLDLLLVFMCGINKEKRREFPQHKFAWWELKSRGWVARIAFASVSKISVLNDFIIRVIFEKSDRLCVYRKLKSLIWYAWNSFWMIFLYKRTVVYKRYWLMARMNSEGESVQSYQQIVIFIGHTLIILFAGVI